ncbi:MAG: hypothetical protein HYY22_07845 [Thaumarchaeota archaeon]|nr:hypothetical protein [Nitrososphaerota archaeon]
MISATRTINISKLKEMAQKLPPNHPFRLSMQYEDTELTPEEYAAKVRGWMRTLRSNGGVS